MKLPIAPTARCWHLPRVCLALLAAALSAHAGVVVVDQAMGPGADFATVQAAVNAAVGGDTILVRNGTYAPFQIVSKSLSVVADGAAVQVFVTPGSAFSSATIQVRDLAANQTVLVQGLRTNFGVTVTNCLGSVWFDEVVCVSGYAYCATGNVHGATVTGSPRVTFTRSVLCGEKGGDHGFVVRPSAHGLSAFSSSVQLFDCEITGGAGAAGALLGTPQVGGLGMRLDGSTVTVVGCTIRGGAGGLGPGPLCTAPHATGGAGVQFVGTAGIIRSAESTAAGGAANLGPLCPGQTGPQGPAIAGTGTIVALPGFARHLSTNSPVRAGQTLVLEAHGVAGDQALILVSLVHEPLPLLNGTLLVGLPAVDMFVLGALSGTGQASLAIPIPGLYGAGESLICYAQAIFLDASQAICLGAGTSVALFAAGF